ncbi:hypothetical protein CYMTET_50191 [Cymbomonas tetramitiformis]|uniref:Sugar phosphate transporter domain-containing protein n=1 Tax=Cymbomonas tetramitiformis TaxID=36881 RepID=A0AAE0BPT2_9CHLO|nr:hypothetical protein CYMTET_50191 [Cymbomonas tetramitiformis]|eukprot:gene4761-5822_t
MSVYQQIVRTYFFVVTWMSISMAVIMFNKWILAYYGFPYPLALTMWHMFFCSSVAFVLVRVLKVVKSIGMSSKDYQRRVVPIGLLYAASLWLSNSAYLYLSVSFIQMTKALMPGLVYMIGCIMGTEVFTPKVTFNMVVIAIGVAIAAYGELNFVMIGVVEQLSSLLFEATRLMLVQVLINSQGLGMNPIQSLYYVSPACFVCLSIPFMALEFPLISERIESGSLIVSPYIMLGNAFAAFALNLAVFLLVGKTSALTMNIAGVLKDWILIWMSASVFAAPVSTLNLVGYFLAFLAVCYYNNHKLQQMKSREKANAKDEEEGGKKEDN